MRAAPSPIVPYFAPPWSFTGRKLDISGSANSNLGNSPDVAFSGAPDGGFAIGHYYTPWPIFLPKATSLSICAGCALYLERRNALLNAISEELGAMLDVVVPQAGMHLVAWLSPHISGLSGQAVVRTASSEGLHIMLVSHFSAKPLERDGLMPGFASATPEELRAGVQKLALALRA